MQVRLFFCSYLVLAMVFNSVDAKGQEHDINLRMKEGFYTEVKGGMYKPRPLDQDFKGYSIKNSALFEIRGGYNFKNFALDLAVTHGPQNKIFLPYINLEEVPGTPINYRHYSKVEFTAVTLNAYYNIAEYKGFTPYVGLGAGMSRNKLHDIKSYADFDLNPDPDRFGSTPGVYHFNQLSKGATATSFAWQVMVGSRVALTKSLEFSAEYKYMDLGKFKQGTTGTLFTTPPTPWLLNADRSKFRVNTFLVGIRYYF